MAMKNAVPTEEQVQTLEQLRRNCGVLAQAIMEKLPPADSSALAAQIDGGAELVFNVALFSGSLTVSLVHPSAKAPLTLAQIELPAMTRVDSTGEESPLQ